MSVEKKIREARRAKASEKANHLLYRVYFALMCSDILHKLGFDATERNKEILHDFHKRVLGYKSISDESQEVVSMFLFLVGIFWAERGMFVRTNERQPLDILEQPLSKVWEYL